MNILKLIDKAIYVCEPRMQKNKIKISLFRRFKISFTVFLKTFAPGAPLRSIYFSKHHLVKQILFQAISFLKIH